MLDLRQLEHQFERLQRKHQFSEPETEAEDEAEGFRERRWLERKSAEAEAAEDRQRNTPPTKRRKRQSEDIAESSGSVQRSRTPSDGGGSE